MRSLSEHLNRIVLCCLILLLSTPFAPRAQDGVKIAIWGDSRENADQGCEQITSLLLNEVTDWDFQVHAGDFTSRGTEEDWKRSLGYKGMNEIFVPGKFFMCTSNHDAARETYDKYTRGVLPVNEANRTTHFYAHRTGDVHVVMCDAVFTQADTMQQWLDSYLEKNVKEEDWLIGVWHHPCYGDITYKSEYLKHCSGWLDSFARHGGDFILHGHAHVYVRTKPLLPDGGIDVKRGMVHITNGTGGASWVDAQEYVDKTAFTPDTRSFASVTFLTLEDGKAHVQTIDARPEQSLRVIDEWTWER